MSAPGLTASARVRFVRRRVLDPGCGQCDDLLSYAVLAADGHEIGEVRGVRLVPWHRNAHPADPHFGVNWVAFDADGHMVASSNGTGESDLVTQFRSRRLAGEALARADAAREEDADG